MADPSSNFSCINSTAKRASKYDSTRPSTKNLCANDYIVRTNLVNHMGGSYIYI